MSRFTKHWLNLVKELSTNENPATPYWGYIQKHTLLNYTPAQMTEPPELLAGDILYITRTESEGVIIDVSSNFHVKEYWSWTWMEVDRGEHTQLLKVKNNDAFIPYPYILPATVNQLKDHFREDITHIETVASSKGVIMISNVPF